MSRTNKKKRIRKNKSLFSRMKPLRKRKDLIEGSWMEFTKETNAKHE